MSDAVNPYQSPETMADPVKPLLVQGAITETMLVFLKSTSPWLRFIGIMGFVGAGLIAVWGILLLALGSVMAQVWASMPGLETVSDLSESMGAAFGILTGILIIGVAALFFVPSHFLYKSGTKIRSYIREGREQDLELALKNNKSYWKFVGIIYIVYLAIIPLTIIISITVAVASALS